MARLETTVLTASETYTRNHAAQNERVETLRTRIAEATSGGRPDMVDRHRKRGKLLVRDRIDLLVDPGTAFLELSSLAAYGQYGGEVPGSGIVTGIGMVHGLPCMVIANDATVKGGSFYHETVQKHIRAQEIAAENRLPCLYLVDCGGAYLPGLSRCPPFRQFLLSPGQHVGQRLAADLGRVRRLHGGGGLYPRAVGRSHHGARQRAHPSGRAFDRQGGDQRRGRWRNAGRGRDAFSCLGRFRPSGRRRTPCAGFDARHRGRAWPVASDGA